MAALLQHDYPGNVRELENAIEHAFVLCSGNIILPEHLPSQFKSISKEVSLYENAAKISEIEKAAIINALRRNSYNRAAAARELGIHKTTLFRKIKEYSIDLPAYDGRSSAGKK